MCVCVHVRISAYDISSKTSIDFWCKWGLNMKSFI